MNTMVRNLVVGGAMFIFLWVGCNDDEETGAEGPSVVAASTGPTSTGTMGQTGTSVSTAAVSTTGAGATGPGCDDVPDTAPSNGSCVMTGSGGGGVGGGAGGGTTTAGQGGGAVALFACNPVTSEPCNTAAGEACDFNGETASWTCFTSGNTQESCQMCNNQNGPWCVPGFTCYSGRNVCRRYCCDDGDCGPTLTCQKNIQSFIEAGAPQIGICM